jgi:hypothetical protein
VQDKIEPTFEIGVLHNTIAPGFMQFYFFHSEVLSETPEVTILEDDTEISLEIGMNENLVSSPYVSSIATDYAGTLTLQVSAEDTSENISDTTQSFTIQPIPATQAQRISLGRAGEFMEIPEGAFIENDYLIAMPNNYGYQYIHYAVDDEQGENLSEVVNISTLTNHYQQDVAFGFQSEDVVDWINHSPGFYRLTDNIWEYIPTFILESENKIWCLIDKPGTYVVKRSADQSPTILPEIFVLSQNYPNPFNPQTIIEYDIPYSTTEMEQIHTKLVIYDILGREVVSLVDSKLAPGKYTARWNGVNHRGERVSSGIYFYSLRSGNHSDTRRMLLLR